MCISLVIHGQFERDIETEHFIHLIGVESYVTERKILEIKNEISTDETMQLLVREIQSEWPENKVLTPVWQYRATSNTPTEMN